ncbi:hypothetical protein ACRQ5Q_12400 [Bradyrhizobium sp. PMVTL-01]|uniref:hypothetical protein n=1 Tax=Bradyrhizobium sp. PMVTL-01 TaxID=3434999 RepID=UPI003F72325A
MLHRIPAVKWALTRLRPAPHGGGIDATPITANDSSALVVDAAETAPAPNISISTDPLPGDAAADETAISVLAEGPSAAPADVSVTEDSSRETPREGEPVVAAEAAISPVDVAPGPTDVPEFIIDNAPPATASRDVAPGETAAAASVEAENESADAEPIAISSDPSPQFPADIEPVVAEETEVVSLDVAIAPVDALSLNGAHAPGIPADVERAVAGAPGVALGGSEVPVEDVFESYIDSAATSSVEIEIEMIPANDPAPIVVAATTESSSDDTPNVVTDIAPEPVFASPAPEARSAPKVRAKPAEPADRAALIRQRWAETGIRMWNPRLHGAGNATLNIQGSIELLPPAAGETMPRYDKLEFKILGGQIVCEGVIVEAPAHAGHRSFTRLAEPRVPDRVREPVRERQAALA